MRSASIDEIRFARPQVFFFVSLSSVENQFHRGMSRKSLIAVVFVRLMDGLPVPAVFSLATAITRFLVR